MLYNIDLSIVDYLLIIVNICTGQEIRVGDFGDHWCGYLSII